MEKLALELHPIHLRRGEGIHGETFLIRRGDSGNFHDFHPFLFNAGPAPQAKI
jgi:hypothetical protein